MARVFESTETAGRSQFSRDRRVTTGTPQGLRPTTIAAESVPPLLLLSVPKSHCSQQMTLALMACGARQSLVQMVLLPAIGMLEDHSASDRREHRSHGPEL